MLQKIYVCRPHSLLNFIKIVPKSSLAEVLKFQECVFCLVFLALYPNASKERDLLLDSQTEYVTDDSQAALDLVVEVDTLSQSGHKPFGKQEPAIADGRAGSADKLLVTG